MWAEPTNFSFSRWSNRSDFLQSLPGAFRRRINSSKGGVRMSIYHLSIKIISRSGGRTAVASAAYRSGEKLYNEETGITHDFTRKKGGIKK